MSLVIADVQCLSILAQIHLTAAESEQTLIKLNGIFALVEELCAIDTCGVEPLNHPIAYVQPALSLRLREDTAVMESNRRADYQAPAPAVQDGLYLVPKVIE